jgi:hypothetical protein
MAPATTHSRRIVVAAGAALLLAGCGASQLDGASAERTIRTLVTSKLGVPVKAVSCPRNVKLQKGRVSVCQVTLASGEVEPFTITQKDGKGNVHIQPMDLVAGAVEKTIVERLAARHVKATAVCPQHVVIRVGASFVCTAHGPTGSSLRITATILDSIGTYSLRAG